MSLAAAPRDLADAAQNAEVLALATSHLEAPCIELHGPEPPTAIQLEAERLVQSRRRFENAPGPAHLSVVWAMSGQADRIVSGFGHERGEDIVRAKVAQLDWLVHGLDQEKTWSVVACDDGGRDLPSSAEAMREVVVEENYPRHGHRSVTVLELGEVLKHKTDLYPVLDLLSTVDDSRMGGSIVAGMAMALKDDTAKSVVERGGTHVVAYTDADLSTNLGQLGLLAAPILERRARACLGQRFGAPGAVLVTPGGPLSEPHSTGSKPNKVSILFRHVVRAMLIPSLGHVADLHAGFKAFDARTLDAVMPQMQSFNDIFDLELLIHMAGRFGAHSIGVEPILHVEEPAARDASAGETDSQDLARLHQIVDLYDQHVALVAPALGQASRLLAVLRQLDVDGYRRIINRLSQLDEGSSSLFDRRWAVEDIVTAVSSRAGFGRC